MNDTELKELWRRQAPIALPSVPSDAELIERMNARLRKFGRDLFWRDVREVAACVFIVIWFGFYLMGHLSLLSQIGCGVVILSAIMISAVLLVARRRDRAAAGPVSVSDSLRAQLRSVTRQARLISNVLWWYLLPSFVGAELFVLGQGISAANAWTLTGVLVFTAVVVYFANSYVLRTKLRPFISEIQQTLESVACLEEDAADSDRKDDAR
jgi:hypothetical protein